MTKKLFISIVVGLFFQFGCAQSIDKSKLDSLFKILETNNKFMGSIAISHNGKIVYSKSIGFADIESNQKITEQTKFRIGSISKMFTASLILKAVEENKLKLNETIDKYFPAIVNSNKITVSNLLNHRSGIHSFTDDADYLSWCTQAKSENEMLAIIAKGKSEFEPDSKAQYSNSNYLLLTIILEKAYKKPFKEILNEKILSPVALQSTYLGGKINLKDAECNSYKLSDKWLLEPETDMSIPLGAGAVVSNPSDLTKFIEALFAGKIISEKSLEQMTTLKDNYGMGIFQIPFYEKKGFGHTGGIDGFTSMLAYFPDDKLSVALTSNATGYDNNNIMIGALSCFFNQPYELPTFKTVALKTEDLDKYLGIYASKDIGLKITVSKNDKTLMAQATGQSAFPLDATDTDVFKFDQAGIVMEFTPNEKKMVLKQGGGVFTFYRE